MIAVSRTKPEVATCQECGNDYMCSPETNNGPVIYRCMTCRQLHKAGLLEAQKRYNGGLRKADFMGAMFFLALIAALVVEAVSPFFQKMP